jgi:hypothetical protein
MQTQFKSLAPCAVLAALATLFFTHESRSQQAAVPSPAAADTVTVPDGTLLYLTLQSDFTSASVKVGDTIEFATPYPVRIGGDVLVPKDTPVYGKISQVLPPRRASRDARVFVTIGRIPLPNGQTAPLRSQKSAPHNAEKDGKEIGNHHNMWTDTDVNRPGTFVGPTIVVTAFTEKGRDWTYKAGSWTTVYFDGPVSFDRHALANLEPPPYEGPAQVFINGPKGKTVSFYLSHVAPNSPVPRQAMTGSLALPARIEFWPGHYTISSHKDNSQAAELDLENDHQYWLEYSHGALTVKDPAAHKSEIELYAVAPWVTNKIVTSWWFHH